MTSAAGSAPHTRHGLVPAEAAAERREEIFAWLILELDRRRGGWPDVLARLRSSRP